MSGRGASPVFIDTGAFYARADEDDKRHGDAVRLFDGIRSNKVAYRPLYTSQAVLSEFATLALYKLGHADATRVLTAVRESESINSVPVDKPAFETAVEQFEEYDDQEISFVDHTTSVLADERGIDHIFAFDSGFRTLGFSLVPGDVSPPDE
jgi:Predicted nucleic acid-binding protein, contains PIN domain